MESIIIPKKLKKVIEKDIEKENKQKYSHLCKRTLNWIIKRAKQYSEKTGISPSEILEGWEKQRKDTYGNFYQEVNQPDPNSDRVIIVESMEDFFKKFPLKKFICSNCNGISTNPDNCTVCNWCAGGLFGTSGKGVYIFLKDKSWIFEIFKPIELTKEV